VTAVRRTATGEPNVIGLDDWRDRLGEFDWVFVSAPATSDTKHMFGADEFAAMKSSAWLVNVARGTLIDQDALLAALNDKAIGGAALDVTDPEPLPADHPLWDAPNCIITMHLSGTAQTRMFQRAAARFVENLKRYRNGDDMIAVADFDRGY
jgi:phosphoglycerate dehydrogenase-like enzyme